MNGDQVQMFYIEHISVHLVLIIVCSQDGLSVSSENNTPYWEEITLFWKQNFILQNWGVFPTMCMILNLCVEFWEDEAWFKKMCVNNRGKTVI